MLASINYDFVPLVTTGNTCGMSPPKIITLDPNKAFESIRSWRSTASIEALFVIGVSFQIIRLALCKSSTDELCLLILQLIFLVVSNGMLNLE